MTVVTFMPLAAAVLGGCAQVPATTANPIEITAGEYDRVFDASIQALRDMRFTVDRKDRRFGVVTSQPLIASSAMEPWYRDNTSSEQVIQSTLHLQRRIVRVELAPADPAPGARADAYRMSVQVEIERRYDPPAELNTALIGASSFRDVRKQVVKQTTETGQEKSRWAKVGRDEQLEQRLIAQILNAATRVPDPAAPETQPETKAPAPEAKPAESPSADPAKPAPDSKPETPSPKP